MPHPSPEPILVTPSVPHRVATAVRWVLIASLSFLGIAGSPAASINSAWSVRVWQSDDGLPNNIVTGLAQTQDGYLWVANPTRLARFDGVQFEEFPARNLTGGSNQRITTLASGHDDALWVATDRGVVACLKAGAVRVFTNNLPALFVESLIEDGDGALWVKNRGGDSIYRIVDGQVTQLPMTGSYRSVVLDSKGRIWFVKNGEVGLFRNGQFETLVQLGKSSSARLTGAKAGGVWICLGSELFKFDEGRPPVSCGVFKTRSASTEPITMVEDRSGAVWIGTSDSGLLRYDGKTFENIPVSHGQIMSLLEDREGNIWVGTGGGGLERVQPRVVELEGMESSLPFQAVQSVCQDTNGNIWATTQNGLLICRTNGGWQTISTNANWPGGRAACVTVDKVGTIWIGTRQKLHCLRDGQFTTLQASDGLAGRNFHALLADTKGDLWIAGNNPESLQRLRNGHFETLKLPPDVQIIHGMAEDAAGNIWIGTSKGLLMRVHDNVLADETTNTAGSLMPIRSLQTTPDGSLWIGYAGGGLGWINKNGRYIRITSNQGLFDDHISQIISDDQGWLWLGSDHGIFKIRQQELEALAEGKIDRVISVHYGPGEGLAGLQANFGESPGVLHDRDGRLWMPMRTALAVINPKSLRENSEPPPVRLKQVIVDDHITAQYGGVATVEKIADTKTALRLPPDHRHLEFVFTALSFTAPENIRFQYQLQGFDNGWMDAGTERRASYSRLAAGAYRFLVRACNSDGIWSRPDAGLAFVVTPFFWQTWWFWLAVLLTFTSVVIAIVRFVSHRQLRLKVQSLERQATLDRERTRIARDIHDDIGNLLTQVTLLSGLTLRDRSEPEKTGEHARQISSTVGQVTSSLDEIVWAVNPRNDTLSQLIDYIGQFTVEFMQTAGIRCRVDLPDHPPQRIVSTDIRHNLFLVVKEALNNVVRHSGANEVWLRTTVTEQTLELMIQDNGRSFDTAAVNGSGNGLRNMRQRMDELGGKFRVGGKSGVGTEILLSVPWSRRIEPD
jgi:signal transduction histidine kinase/ligand-binding sensor domain-containing protein